MSPRPKVMLFIETSSIYGRRILEGITHYLRGSRGWSIVLEQRALTSRTPSWLSDWNGDGIISRSTNKILARQWMEKGIPVVDLTDRHGDSGLPLIWSDDDQIGELAAEHLLSRGFTQFAFCGYAREHWSSRRGKAFAASLGSRQYGCEVYESPWRPLESGPWEVEQLELVQWLQKLPRPIGIMCCNDVRGQQILDACQLASLAVPEEVAVIGCDDDDLLCNICQPSLSSVIPNSQMIGYRAAESLEQLMLDPTKSLPPQYIPPLGVAARGSTDTSAIPDRQISAALRLIRERACDGLTVNDVMSTLQISRSSLERGFRKYLQRSPQMEIRQVQIRSVKQLLAESSHPLVKIAEMTGFEHPEYLNVVFKRLVGQTPGQYREQSRANRVGDL